MYRKSYGRIFTIYVSKNEVVSCKVQTNSGSFHLARFIKNVLGAFSRFMCRKTELFFCEVETHFGSFLHARFMKKVTGTFSRFLRRKMKLFAIEFRRILEVLSLRGLQKKLWAYFHDLCVQKSCC